MSKRNERREAERLARKLAYQQSRQPSQAAAQLETQLPDRATTAAQRAANRANAQLSTGPVTDKGKAISSRNNTRHGLSAETHTSDFHVLAGENQALFDQDLANFRKE